MFILVFLVDSCLDSTEGKRMVQKYEELIQLLKK